MDERCVGPHQITSTCALCLILLNLGLFLVTCLQASLHKRGEEQAEQEERWKEERARLQHKLNRRGLEHLRLEQEVEELKRQLQETASRAMHAEAAASVMRCEHMC